MDDPVTGDVPTPRPTPVRLPRSQGELRALFDSLQLDVVYQLADSAAGVTLYDAGRTDVDDSAQVRAEDWLAPPAGFEPAHMV